MTYQDKQAQRVHLSGQLQFFLVKQLIDLKYLNYRRTNNNDDDGDDVGFDLLFLEFTKALALNKNLTTIDNCFQFLQCTKK